MADSAYSARPSALAKPVPGADEEAQAAAAFFGAGKIPDVTPAVDEEAQAAAAFFGQGAADPVAESQVGIPTGGEFAPQADRSPEILSSEMLTESAAANATPGGVMKQITDFKDRLVTSFAANDREKLGYLRNKYGENNVRYVGEKVYFRKDPKGKFQHLDPNTLEVMNDFIADFAGDAVREAAMLPGELAGGAAGFVSGIGTGPGALATAAAGARAGRVASVPLANRAVNKIGKALGLPQDEGRSQMTEDLTGMAAEAVLPILGRKLSKFIPGTADHAAAAKLAQGRNAPLVLTENSREFKQIAQELNDSGQVKIIDGAQYGIPGINVPVFAHQIEPDNPLLMRAVNAAVKDEKTAIPFQNVLREQGQATKALVEDTLKAVASPEKRLSNKPISEVVLSAVGEINANEQQAVGKFRNAAIAKLGNAKQQLPAETSQKAVEIMKELGFQPKRVVLNSVTRPGSLEGAAERGMTATNKIERITWIPPKNLQPIIGRLGLDDGQTRAVVNVLNEYGQLVSRGNEARLTDVERLVKRMGALNPKLRGSALSGQWGALTGELRQHRRSMIESGLPDDVSRSAFNETMDKYSADREVINNIADSVNTKMGSHAVVKTLLGKGKESVGEARALSALLKESHPDAWNSLKAEWADQTIEQFRDKKSVTGFNTDALLKHLNGGDGKEMLRVLYDGNEGNAADLIKTIKFAGRINDSYVPVAQMTDEKKKQVVRNGIGAILASKYIAVMSLVRLTGTSRGGMDNLTEILTQDGIDKYIDGSVPKAQRSFVARKLREYVVASQASGAFRRASPLIPPAKRLVRSTLMRKGSATNADKAQIQTEETYRNQPAETEE